MEKESSDKSEHSTEIVQASMIPEESTSKPVRVPRQFEHLSRGRIGDPSCNSRHDVLGRRSSCVRLTSEFAQR